MDSAISVVVGIVQHPISKQLLITQRKKDQHLANYWEFPGGKVEVNESEFHALKRELNEEVNIEVLSAYPLKKLTHHYEDKTVHLSFYRIMHYQGEPKPNEGQTMEWVDLSKLDTFKFPDANIPIIKSLSFHQFWAITPDCNLDSIDQFISSIKNSMSTFGLKQVLFRSKHLNDKDYYQIYEQLKVDKKLEGVHFILNREQIDLEKNSSWHLTSKQLYDHVSRPYQKGFLSASCHTLDDIRQAELIGCDCVLLSAVNKTRSHPNGQVLGWQSFKHMANSTTLPVYALGGVKREDLAVSQYQGAIGIAGISSFKVHNE